MRRSSPGWRWPDQQARRGRRRLAVLAVNQGCRARFGKGRLVLHVGQRPQGDLVRGRLAGGRFRGFWAMG